MQTRPARLLLAMALSALSCGPALTYERSPQWHHDHFENPPGWPRFPGVRDFFRWRLGGGSHALRPKGFRPPTVPNDGALLRQNRDRVSLTWIGHATLLLQAGGLSVLTDPIFSKSVQGLFARRAPPGVAFGDLPPVDLVVISHNHFDHLDKGTILRLPPGTRYVVPLGIGPWLRALGRTQVTELDWWESVPLGDRGRVTLVPAQHQSQRGLGDRNQTLWGGYVLEIAGTRFYFAGDTGYPAAFGEIGRRFPGIDYAILPIGAYDPRWFMHPQHISPEEAAQAFGELHAARLVPMHWGTFHLSDEPMDEPPLRLRRAMGADAGRIIPLKIGETYWGGP